MWNKCVQLEKDGGMSWEIGIGICVSPCVKQPVGGSLLSSPESGRGALWRPVRAGWGKEGSPRGGRCVCSYSRFTLLYNRN